MNLLTHEKTTARDFFLYLLTVGLLFTCMWSLISLWFALLDMWMPYADPYNYFGQGNHYELRSALATIIIAFPFYLGLAWYLRKDMIRHPEKRDIGVRKFLLHFTLFVTALTIIIDLIALVRSFLEGELTLRFLLKVAVVLLVAGSIFLYYLWDLRRETTPQSKPSLLIATLAALLFAVSIGFGFAYVESPFKQRQKKIDETRSNHLQNIESSIQNYWLQNQKLPALDEYAQFIHKDIRFDPSTKEPYEYRILAKTRYELCATFDTDTFQDSSGARPYPPYGLSWWEHGKGRTCYSRDVSPSPEFAPGKLVL